MEASDVRASVSEYYGKELGGTCDLKTSACMIGGETSSDVTKLLRNVHPDVLARFYGCGSPIPPLMRGMVVLDLGCGTGRDSYVLSQLVGPEGTVIGVDMTSEQLTVAQDTQLWHAAKFGFEKPNTRFVRGDISNLAAAGISDASVDVVVSNCVLNLVADKAAVFREIARILKPGGELYFSDVYADRRIPSALQRDKVLWGECLSGALYRGDFARIMRSVGLVHWWTVTSRRIVIDDAAVQRATAGISFFSETIRAIKADGLEDAPEDYGQTAKYSGAVLGSPHAFSLGLGAVFITDQRTSVDGNTAAALQASRYRDVFRVTERGSHRGGFGAAPITATAASGNGDAADAAAGSSCCPPPRSLGSTDAAAAAAAPSSCCAPAPAASSSCCAPAPASAPSCCAPSSDAAGSLCC